MPKILRIINRLNIGGPAFNAAYLTKYLSPEFETLLVAGMIDETEASADFVTQEMGLKPVYIPEMYREIQLFKDRQAYLRLKTIIADFKPDIVHTHAAKAGTLGRLAAAAHGVPVVLHTFHGHVFHSYFSPWKTNLFIRIEQFLAKKSTCIIAISRQQKDELSNKYAICNPEKIEVIPLGFNLEKFSTGQTAKRIKFREQYRVEDNEIVIVIVGRLVPVKNHALFLHVLHALKSQTSKKIRAFIIGDGEYRNQLESLAASLDIDFTDYNTHPRPALLTFTSWITDVDEVYAGAEIVALTSLNEGTPVSLIEAQAAGKAIVTTNVGGIGDIVIHGQTALVSEAADRNGFIANLLQLIEDEDFRCKMSSYDATLVSARFDFRRLITETASLYNRLLNSTGS